MFNEADIEKMFIDRATQNGWQYVPSDQIPHSMDSVLVNSWLRDSLLRLNPGLTEEQAGQVIHKLRAAIIGVQPHDLVAANERFRDLLFEQNTYPFGKDGDHIPVRFFAEGDDEQQLNSYVITNQWCYPKASCEGGKRLDVVMLVNGIPLIIGELKTPVRASVSWADGAQDIQSYEQSIPQMFVPNVLNFASEGKTFRYASIGAPLTKWGPWFEDEDHSEGTLELATKSFTDMLQPKRIVDIMRYFTLYATDRKFRKIKVICRYQQYEGANAIVERVLNGYPRQGLIWHFQGSGKSLLMVFAAQKIRMQQALKSPTVVIVDDRIDLETQITADFMSADIPNLASAGSKDELIEFFEQDQRKILITTIFKFGDVTSKLSDRGNIIVMVDEAHRTQEGNLGDKMRTALPNAFFFGLTGTPINRLDHNTFATFGAKEDPSGYMSRYSFADSIRDGATLKLEFQPVPVELKIDKETLEKEFAELTDQITDEERNTLVRKTRIEALFTAPDRIQKVSEHIVTHFQSSIEPTGLKAQVVVYNRACCVAYKKAIDALLGTTDATAIVMHTDGDKSGEYQQYRLDKDQEAKLLDRFRDPQDPLKIVIVTSKLLTGFDAPILQCMYLDKPMKDHTLLQAICRTNRVYDERKQCGLIVDYVGIFDDVAKALSFDDQTVRNVISNINEIIAKLPEYLEKCLAYFPGVDRTVGGFDGLLAAQDKLPTSEIQDRFAADFQVLSRAWDIVTPEPRLASFKNDYVWLCQVYNSIKPISPVGPLIWKILGAKTIELVHRHVTTIDIGCGEELPNLVIDPHVLDDVITEIDAKKKSKRIEVILVARLRKHAGNPKFKAFGEKLEDLKRKMEQELISSIDFLKNLLTIAKEVLEAEKEVEPEDNRAKARAALTELFESIKNPQTPIIVEKIVNDIDTQIVEIVRRFSDAFSTVSGRREIQQRLRSTLYIKYKIKDKEVFEKAYRYIEQYY